MSATASPYPRCAPERHQESVRGIDISGVEVYMRALTICEVLGIFEHWRNQSAGGPPPFPFRAIVRQIAGHCELDKMLTALLPDEPLFRTPIEERSRHNAYCFKDTHVRLLEARETLLPWLLLDTHEYSPVAAEAYRGLRLHDMRATLDKMASVLQAGTSRINAGDHYNRSSYIEDQKKQIGYLLDQLYEYGIDAGTYAEAVEQYTQFVATVFPPSVQPRIANRAVATVRRPPYPRLA